MILTHFPSFSTSLQFFIYITYLNSKYAYLLKPNKENIYKKILEKKCYYKLENIQYKQIVYFFIETGIKIVQNDLVKGSKELIVNMLST